MTATIRAFLELPGTVLTDAESRQVLDQLLTGATLETDLPFHGTARVAAFRSLAVVISNLLDRVKALEAKEVAP